MSQQALKPLNGETLAVCGKVRTADEDFAKAVIRKTSQCPVIWEMRFQGIPDRHSYR
jgi:hypothetical protein